MTDQPTANQQHGSNDCQPRETQKDKNAGDDQEVDAMKQESSDESTEPNVIRVPLKPHPPKLLGPDETPKDLRVTTQRSNRTKPGADDFSARGAPSGEHGEDRRAR
jgi:hypothetical protein